MNYVFDYSNVVTFRSGYGGNGMHACLQCACVRACVHVCVCMHDSPYQGHEQLKFRQTMLQVI